METTTLALILAGTLATAGALWWALRQPSDDAPIEDAPAPASPRAAPPPRELAAQRAAPARLPRRLTGQRPQPAADIEIEYADFHGELSERRVLVTAMEGNATEADGIVAIEKFAGLCLLRHAHRNFIVGRVQRLRATGTSDWLTDPDDIAAHFITTARAAASKPEARLTRTEKRRARKAIIE